MRNTSGLKRGGNPGRPKGIPNRTTVEIREFARSILERPKFRAQLARQADAGTLHPTLLTLLHHYAYGTPRQHVEIDTPAAPIFYIASMPQLTPHVSLPAPAAIDLDPDPDPTPTDPTPKVPKEH